MDKDKLLDLSASIGKFNVENSNLLRDEKEYIKSNIDLVTDILKTNQSNTNNISVMGFSISTIKNMKMLASQFSIDKVIVFPVFYDSGDYQILIKVIGQDREDFFDNINVQKLYNISEENETTFDKFEKDYGVIIYERDWLFDIITMVTTQQDK